MTEPFGRPAYQQVADDLRQRIASGEFRVGSAIPSTTRLTQDYGVSVTVVRAAVNQLRNDGVLAGQPGKGVFVRATPAAAAERAVGIEDLAEQVAELRAELRGSGTAERDGLAAEIRELRGSVALIRERLIDLYVQLGKPFPDDDRPAGSDAESAAPRKAWN